MSAAAPLAPAERSTTLDTLRGFALLLQTIICTTVFYGHGLGYFGQVPRTGRR